MTTPISRLFILSLALCGGCAATVIPPAVEPGKGAPIRVADYGYHSTLILTRSDGRLVEYAFGDWSYFGKNEKSFGNALHALFLSEKATLGRRLIEPLPESLKLDEATGALTIVELEAPKEKVTALERELDERFTSGIDSLYWSKVHNLYFVQDDKPYSLKNNCNVETARWLEKAGCKVRGWVIGSKFVVGSASADGTGVGNDSVR